MWINKMLDMDENKKLRPELGPDTPLRRTLIDKATTAGTPACLVSGFHLLEKHRTLHHSIDMYVNTCKFGWELVEQTLSELERKHEGPK